MEPTIGVDIRAIAKEMWAIETNSCPQVVIKIGDESIQVHKILLLKIKFFHRLFIEDNITLSKENDIEIIPLDTKVLPFITMTAFRLFYHLLYNKFMTKEFDVKEETC